MASHVLTEQDLKDLFFGITRSILDFPVDKIRFEFPRLGQPAFKSDQDVAAINITLIDSPVDKQRHVIYTTSPTPNMVTRVTSYTEVVQVQWFVYGPNSFDNIRTLRDGIQMQAALDVLRAQKVYLVTQVPQVVKIPLAFNNQYYQRSDLKVMFNMATIREEEIPYFEGVTITVPTDIGLEETISIEEPTP